MPIWCMCHFMNKFNLDKQKIWKNNSQNVHTRKDEWRKRNAKIEKKERIPKYLQVTTVQDIAMSQVKQTALAAHAACLTIPKFSSNKDIAWLSILGLFGTVFCFKPSIFLKVSVLSFQIFYFTGQYVTEFLILSCLAFRYFCLIHLIYSNHSI